MKELPRNIQNFRDFSEFLTHGTTERLYKLNDWGSHVNMYMEIISMKHKGLAGRVKAIFQKSNKEIPSSVLNADVVNNYWDGLGWQDLKKLFLYTWF